MKSDRWLLRVIACILFALVLVFFWIKGRDQPPPAVDDLRRERTVTAPEDDAFPLFAKASDEFTALSDAELKVMVAFNAGREMDRTALAAMLATRAESLNAIREGSRRTLCAIPEAASPADASRFVAEWLTLGRLFAIKARLERLDGDAAGAAQSCLALLRFGVLVLEGSETLLQYLTGTAIVTLGVDETLALLRETELNTADLAELRSLSNEHAPTEGLRRALKGEYRLQEIMIADIASGSVSGEEITRLPGDAKATVRHRRPLRYLFHPNRTRQLVADLTRNLLAQADLPLARQEAIDVDALIDLPESRLRLRFPSNLIGKLYFSIALPSLDRVREHQAQCRTGLAAVRLAAACHAYRLDTGKLPPSLEDLVPKFLAAVPDDPYDGQPFRYDPKRSLLYAVGLNFSDDGGVANRAGEGEEPKSRWESLDVLFPIGTSENN